MINATKNDKTLKIFGFGNVKSKLQIMYDGTSFVKCILLLTLFFYQTDPFFMVGQKYDLLFFYQDKTLIFSNKKKWDLFFFGGGKARWLANAGKNKSKLASQGRGNCHDVRRLQT